MEILYFLLIGLAAGLLAGFVIPNKFGWIGSLVVGVIGAVIGGYLFKQLGVNIGGPEWLGQVVAAAVGAILLLVVLKFVAKTT